MEITQVTQKSPSVWVLTLADGRSYEIDRTRVLEYALLNRLEIDDETLQEMQQTYCERHALQQALRWLNYRPYTFKAMFQRLMPIYGEATSFAVLKRLTEMGGINDYQYAQQMARSAVERKGYGLRRAAEMMRQKGVPKNVIAAVLQPYEETVPERLQQILERHYAEKLSDPSDRKMVERVKAALVRKGYSFSEIQAAVQRYWEESEPCKQSKFLQMVRAAEIRELAAGVLCCDMEQRRKNFPAVLHRRPTTAWN